MWAWFRFSIVVAALVSPALWASPASAQAPRTAAQRLEIVKETQNPLSRQLGALTLEHTAGFRATPSHETGHTFSINPAFPIAVGKRLTLINRTFLPVFNQPSPAGDGTRTSGIGDVLQSVLLSPRTDRRLVWGLGPVLGFPTASEETLGSDKWLLGPSAIFVVAPGRSVLGLVVQNLWTVGGKSSRRNVKELLLRPLVNINLPHQWYITSKPAIQADWQQRSSDRWTVETGGGLGKVFRIGRLGIALEAQAFGYPIRPRGAASWAARFNLKLLLRRGELVGRLRDATRGTPAN